MRIFHLLLKCTIFQYIVFSMALKEGIKISLPQQPLLKEWAYLRRDISFLNTFSLLSIK